MAGIGKRFHKSIFLLPKPLIQIKNKPMFLMAAKSMPKSDLNIFICNKKIAEKYKINQLLSKEFPKKFKLIKVKKNTKGQADTCLLAKNFLKNDDKIFVHSCDSLIKFESNTLRPNLDKYDGLIFTTKPNINHIQYNKSYGWVNLENDIIHKITCKKKASPNPKKDFVIIGTFAFSNKKTFLRLINDLIKEKQKINNEYYLDMAFKIAIEKKNKIKNIIVKSYHNWGTPNELINWKKKFEKKIIK